MTEITCVRCQATRARVPFKPFPNAIGQRVFDEICNTCWQEWLKYQQQLINHYGLNLQDPQAKQFLYQNLEQFLFSGGSPAGS